MKKMKHILFFLSLFSIVLFTTPLKAAHEKNSRSGLYRVEAPTSLSEKDRDHLMFTNFVGIVVNFVKLFMDPHNIPEAKQNAYNILNGINNLAHVITRSGLSKARQEELVMKIIELCKNYYNVK